MIIQVNAQIFQHHLLKTFPYLTEFLLLQISWLCSVQVYFGTLFFSMQLYIWSYGKTMLPKLIFTFGSNQGESSSFSCQNHFCCFVDFSTIFFFTFVDFSTIFFYSSCQFLPKSFWSNIRRWQNRKSLALFPFTESVATIHR